MATDVRRAEIDRWLAEREITDTASAVGYLMAELMRLEARVARLEAEIERRNGDGR
jgi:hypothetical protein